MLCRRVQKKGKPFSKDETHVHSLHRYLLLPYPRGLEAAGQGCGSMTKVKGGCWGGHTSSSKLSPLSHLCRARVCGQTDNCRQGTRERAAEGLGKASPWLAQPAAVTCPPQGYRPVCPPRSPGTWRGGAAHPWPWPRWELVALASAEAACWDWEGEQGQLPSRILERASHIASRDAAAVVGICRQKSPDVSEAA